MKYTIHMLVVGSVLFGGDVFFNHGNETRALMFGSKVAVSSGVRVQAYHMSEFIDRNVNILLPRN